MSGYNEIENNESTKVKEARKTRFRNFIP